MRGRTPAGHQRALTLPSVWLNPWSEEHPRSERGSLERCVICVDANASPIWCWSGRPEKLPAAWEMYIFSVSIETFFFHGNENSLFCMWHEEMTYNSVDLLLFRWKLWQALRSGERVHNGNSVLSKLISSPLSSRRITVTRFVSFFNALHTFPCIGYTLGDLQTYQWLHKCVFFSCHFDDGVWGRHRLLQIYLRPVRNPVTMLL